MKNVCDELIENWNFISEKSWIAEAKGRYYNYIFSELIDTAESVYNNNISLQNEVNYCLSLCSKNERSY